MAKSRGSASSRKAGANRTSKFDHGKPLPKSLSGKVQPTFPIKGSPVVTIGS